MTDSERVEQESATPSDVADAIRDILGTQEDGTWNVSPFRWRERIEFQLARIWPKLLISERTTLVLWQQEMQRRLDAEDKLFALRAAIKAWHSDCTDIDALIRLQEIGESL